MSGRLAARSRRSVLLASSAAASVALLAPTLASADDRTVSAARTVECERHHQVLSLHFGIWGGAGTPLGRREFFAAVESMGANRPGGVVLYGAVTPTRRAVLSECRVATGAAPGSTARLGGRHVYRRTSNGAVFFVAPDRSTLPGAAQNILPHRQRPLAVRRAFSLELRCFVGGRVLLHVSPRRDARGRETGSLITVRTTASRQLLAQALLSRTGDSWFRAANTCHRF